MADVKLGPTGAETTLPVLRFIGSPPAWPVSMNRQIEVAEMVDGSKRPAFFGTDKEFSIVLGYLTLAQLNIVKGLNALNQTLRYQNSNEDATWHDVIIKAFSYDPERTDIRNLGRYICRMTLEGV